jgi:hypothetical protein
LAALDGDPGVERSLRVIDFGQARPLRSDYIPDRDATAARH